MFTVSGGVKNLPQTSPNVSESSPIVPKRVQIHPKRVPIVPKRPPKQFRKTAAEPPYFVRLPSTVTLTQSSASSEPGWLLNRG